MGTKWAEYPESLKRSIPFAQALRTQQICTTQHDCDKIWNLLEAKHKERRYKEAEIKEGLAKACKSGRNEVLKERTSKYINIVPLVLTCNRILLDIKNQITKNWNILQRNRRV